VSTIENFPVLFDDTATAEGQGSEGLTRINASLSFVDRAGARVVLRWQEPLYRFAISDTLTLRFAAVQVRLGELATQEEVSQAFGHSVATQRRWENRYQERGLVGLEKVKSTGRPCRIPETCDLLLSKWFAQGVSNATMARRLTVSDVAIHRALARLGLRRRKPATRPLLWPADDTGSPGLGQVDEQSLPAQDAEEQVSEELSASAQREESFSNAVSAEMVASVEEIVQSSAQSNVTMEAKAPADQGGCGTESWDDVLVSLAEEGFTIDRDPDDRAGDRGLACLGQLDDAIPLFKDRPALPRGGVLLAIPLLVSSGLLEVFSEIYHSLGPAFYGLRTMVVVLFQSALLRIKRPEHFKECSPRELGQMLGLDRAPEVKTVRRKLTQMAELKRARAVMHAMAQRRIDEDSDRVAFLYVDGHVREYHGQHRLAKGKKSQNQLAKPAATDNWVHDAYGEPLLVVTSEMNEGLTKVLEPILMDVKQLVGDRRPTVIFDRGGFSPKLFVRLVKRGFDVMTYRKGKILPWPVSHFAEKELVVDGRTYHYQLAERTRVKVGRLRSKRKKRSKHLGPQYLWMREVRVLRADGRQTAILLTRKDLNVEEVPYRQFNRWRQENYFKYMDAEFELDALVEYAVQPVSQGQDRPNPARRPVERELASARTRVQQLQAKLGEAVGAARKSPPRTLRGFKIADAKLRAELTEAECEVCRFQEQLKELPKRVPADGLEAQTTEKKLIVDTIKMAAYQVETRLLAMLGEHYCRADDEGRTLLHAAFQSTASLEVRGDILWVELVPQSSPHRTEALRALCTDLNALSAKFPGSNLRLHLTVQPHKPLINPDGVCQEF
jgi:transposase